jgi:poly [ADP-ribose] polymerase
LIQLIEKGSLSQKQYYVWLRWGRVGKAGQCNLESYGSDLIRAKDFFLKKFYDKTNNEFHEKDLFEKCPGKYDLVHKDYNAEIENNTQSEAKSVNSKNGEIKEEKIEIPSSKLDKKVQDLVELICNVTEMENTLKEMKYDAKKAPLGKLSKSQIKAGYAALSELEDLINKKATGRKLIDANNDFYTRIPHDFGMRTPPLITTQSQIREKMKLLEILGDIEIAVKILNQKSEIVNPIDRHYDQLECNLKPLDHSDEIFKLIDKYLQNTHAPTHMNYKLKLLDVFETHKEAEEKRFTDLGNRMLLWHGSRITNWASILMQGLRIGKTYFYFFLFLIGLFLNENFVS